MFQNFSQFFHSSFFFKLGPVALNVLGAGIVRPAHTVCNSQQHLSFHCRLAMPARHAASQSWIIPWRDSFQIAKRFIHSCDGQLPWRENNSSLRELQTTVTDDKLEPFSPFWLKPFINTVQYYVFELNCDQHDNIFPSCLKYFPIHSSFTPFRPRYPTPFFFIIHPDILANLCQVHNSVFGVLKRRQFCEVDMNLIHDEVTEYRLKEKLLHLSNDSFNVIRESDGRKLYRAEGKSSDSSGTKTLCDMHGRALYTMRTALVSMHNRIHVQNAHNGETVITMKTKKSLATPLSKQSQSVYIWKGDSDHGKPWLELCGDLIRKDYTFKNLDTATDAAFVTKKLIKLSSILAESDTYVLRINPGYNVALFVFIAIVIDEQYQNE